MDEFEKLWGGYNPREDTDGLDKKITDWLSTTLDKVDKEAREEEGDMKYIVFKSVATGNCWGTQIKKFNNKEDAVMYVDRNGGKVLGVPFYYNPNQN